MGVAKESLTDHAFEPYFHDPAKCKACGRLEHSHDVDPMTDDVHTFFGLSYANYLVLHRSGLQSMPEEWQQRFVALLNEYNDALERHGIETPPSYSVQARDDGGRFTRDPVPHYNRGRTRLWTFDPEDHAPWHYTEFGVQCLCDAWITSDDDRCAVMVRNGWYWPDDY